MATKPEPPVRVRCLLFVVVIGFISAVASTENVPAHSLELDENELLSRIIKRLEKSSAKLDRPGQCKVSTNEKTIIKKVDSINNGADFLTLFKNVESYSVCADYCCKNASCDLAVFEDKGDNVCYLFRCQGKCKFSQHDHFVSSVIVHTDLSHARHHIDTDDEDLDNADDDDEEEREKGWSHRTESADTDVTDEENEKDHAHSHTSDVENKESEKDGRHSSESDTDVENKESEKDGRHSSEADVEHKESEKDGRHSSEADVENKGSEKDGRHSSEADADVSDADGDKTKTHDVQTEDTKVNGGRESVTRKPGISFTTPAPSASSSSTVTTTTTHSDESSEEHTAQHEDDNDSKDKDNNDSKNEEEEDDDNNHQTDGHHGETKGKTDSGDKSSPASNEDDNSEDSSSTSSEETSSNTSDKEKQGDTANKTPAPPTPLIPTNSSGAEGGFVRVEGVGEQEMNLQVPIIALSVGLAFTAIILVIVTCRLCSVKRKLRKGRPLHSYEADYLINGMYL